MSKTVHVEAIAYHTHYNDKGERAEHQVGDTYSVTDGLGMTADDMASSLEALKFAKRVEKPAKKAEPAKAAPVDKAEEPSEKKPVDEPKALKAEAASKTVEHRKQDVPTIKK